MYINNYKIKQEYFWQAYKSALSSTHLKVFWNYAIFKTHKELFTG